ncbi:hypothetical protein IH768_20870, partial [Escherichia coli]|nr:hypothetical protein [Escherichia coli]
HLKNTIIHLISKLAASPAAALKRWPLLAEFAQQK